MKIAVPKKRSLIETNGNTLELHGKKHSRGTLRERDLMVDFFPSSTAREEVVFFDKMLFYGKSQWQLAEDPSFHKSILPLTAYNIH